MMARGSGMTNKELLYIITVADSGSFSLAAESLNISHSALSQAIHKVEENLGFRLFFRGGTKTRPTASGQKVIQFGRPVLAKWKSFESKLSDFSSLNENHLNVYAPPLFYKSFLPAVIEEFGKSYPEITVNAMETANSTEAENLAYNEIADISLVWEPVGNGSLSRIPVFRTELLLAVPSTHPICREKPFTDFDHIQTISMEEMKRFRDFPVSLTSYKRTSAIVSSFIGSLDFEPIIKESTTVWSYLVDYVANGNRIALIDELECTSSTTVGKQIAFYRIKDAHLDHSLVACFCAGRTLSKPVHLFLDALKRYPSIASRNY